MHTVLITAIDKYVAYVPALGGFTWGYSPSPMNNEQLAGALTWLGNQDVIIARVE